jgi:hypothetical protein
VNSRFSRQWFCERKAMKEVRVYGGGAVLLSISARLGFRHCRLGRVCGMETVKGAGCDWQSVMAMVELWSSEAEWCECVGEVAVEADEDDVFIDRAWFPVLRVTMTLFQNCL